MASTAGERIAGTAPVASELNQARDNHDLAGSHASKFRFKSSKRKSRDDEDRQNLSDDNSHRHRRHHHRTKRRKEPYQHDDPSLYDDTHLPNASSPQFLDPDTAFRESLFDAMADDEGAQFWEGVYGQPIPKIDPVKEGPTGELEAMTEEEYAAHVRAEMYKKTHQYLFEEKAKRDKAKKERDRLSERLRRQEEASERFRKQVEESLRRGKERKERVQRGSTWAQKWKDYQDLWAEFRDGTMTGPPKIPWPVWRGKKDDIGKDEIESFFLNAPTAGNPDQADLLKTLKGERVRWHPDKIQQRLGGQDIEEITLKDVTAVFQIIDRMWNNVRDGRP